MKTNNPRLNSILLIGLLLSVGITTNASPLGTAFTYQGRLNDGSSAANNLYDLDFALFDVPAGGSQLGLSMTYNGLPVSNGLFTVTLDFGASPFVGEARWLQIQVRTNGGRTPPPYTLLTPRQALTPAPYALYAPSAGSAVTASNVAPFSVTAGSIADGSITAGKFASGQVVKSLNGLFDTVTLSAGTNVTLTPSGNDLKISATPGTVVTNAGWGIAGNSGTTAANFLGTMDGQPLELRVNGQRALRIEPGASGAPNVVGGSVSNRVAAGVIGATVAGGGNSLGGAHRIEADYGSIGGGYQNTIQTGATLAFIAGGYGNTIRTSAFDASIGGGAANTIQSNAYLSTIGGGSDNSIQVNAQNSTIAGGEQNTIQTDAYRSTISGGSNHQIGANATNSLIAGGYGNTVEASAWNSTIGGGSQNSIHTNSQFCMIGGGYGNAIQTNAPSSAIGGGYENTIWAYNSAIGGGAQNTIQTNAHQSTISGGRGNTIQNSALDSTIGGGYGNTIEEYASSSTIAGGDWNLIESDYEVGYHYGTTCATIGGGIQNSILVDSERATIGGGQENTIKNAARSSTIGGGYRNCIETNAQEGTIGGGYRNTVGGSYATVPGGSYNTAAGDSSLAAGSGAQAMHAGAFVWADNSTTDDYASTGNNQFCIRASGGVQLSPGTSFYCGSQTRQMLNLWSTNYGIGVQAGALYFRASDDNVGNGFAWYRGGSHNDTFLNGGAGSLTLMSLNVSGLSVSGVVNATAFNPSSDRNLKENFAAVSPREVLDKVTALPISRWNFKGDAATPHVGPMAQDFHAAFALGTDDKHIATVDADGVALAAIQGLNQKLEERLRTKDAEIQELRQAITELKQLVNQSTQ